MTLWLTLFATPLFAEQIWSARLLGVKIGVLETGWSTSDQAYRAEASFRTTGLAGSLAHVTFDLHADGVLHPTLTPLRYQEHMHTGRRESAAQIRFSGGYPQKISGRLAAQTQPLPKIPQPPLDPMTALMAALRDQAATPTCTFDRHVFDGARLTRILFISRRPATSAVTCHAHYHRIAGYSAKEMAEAQSFPIAITYQEHAGTWRATRLTLKSLYGPVTLVRRD